jgi:hypothetical protein
MMALLGRIVVIFFALIIAIIAAGITLAIGILVPDWSWMDSDPVERFVFFATSFFTTSLVGATAFVPAVLLIILSETIRMRRLLYYAVAGAVVGLAAYFGSDIELRLENTTDVAPVVHPLQFAAAAGIVGGLFYWLIAGRNAARWREG